MTFSVILERDEDGYWCISCPAIPGCHSQGDTRAEAIFNIQEAIAACLEARIENGMPLFLEAAEVEIPLPIIETQISTTERA